MTTQWTLLSLESALRANSFWLQHSGNGLEDHSFRVSMGSVCIKKLYCWLVFFPCWVSPDVLNPLSSLPLPSAAILHSWARVMLSCFSPRPALSVLLQHLPFYWRNPNLELWYCSSFLPVGIRYSDQKQLQGGKGLLQLTGCSPLFQEVCWGPGGKNQEEHGLLAYA